MGDKSKFLIQDEQYAVPYHWLMYEDEFRSKVIEKIYSPGSFWYKSGIDVIAEKILELYPMKYMDVGCGDGKLIDVVVSKVKMGGIYIRGCDLSESAIKWAKTLIPYADFYCKDFYEVEGIFDVISCVETLEHIPDEQIVDFIRHLFAKLEIEGHLIISVPTICRPVAPKHFRHYTLKLLKDQINEAGVNYEIEWVGFLNRITPLAELYYKLYANSKLPHIHRVNRWFWRYYYKSCLFGTNEQDSIRLVTVIKKLNV